MRNESYRLGLTESEHVGHLVGLLLTRRGHTQTWLAQRMGISPTTMSDMMRGRRTWDRSDITAAASLLDVAEADLLPPALSRLANFGVYGRAARHISQIAEMLLAVESRPDLLDAAVKAVHDALIKRRTQVKLPP